MECLNSEKEHFLTFFKHFRPTNYINDFELNFLHGEISHRSYHFQYFGAAFCSLFSLCLRILGTFPHYAFQIAPSPWVLLRPHLVDFFLPHSTYLLTSHKICLFMMLAALLGPLHTHCLPFTGGISVPRGQRFLLFVHRCLAYCFAWRRGAVHAC